MSPEDISWEISQIPLKAFIYAKSQKKLCVERERNTIVENWTRNSLSFSNPQKMFSEKRLNATWPSF